MFIRLMKQWKLQKPFGDDGSSGGGGDTTATASVVNDTTSTESSFDMATAVDDISDSLGFKPTTPAAEKPATAVAPPAATPAPATPAVPTPEGTQPPAPVTTPLAVAPKTWKPEEAASWAQIPEAAKAAIMRREDDMFRGVEQYKATASFGNTVQEVLKPYTAIMQAHGIDPVQNIQNLMGAHYQLATGTAESKLVLFQQLAKDYNVDLGQIEAANPYQLPADPEVVALKQQLATIQSGQARLEQERNQQKQAEYSDLVSKFATDPKNVHFEALGDDIAQLLRTDRNLSLEQAYEKAVWGNPETRAKEIARINTEKQTAVQVEATKRAAEAKQALAANVQIQPKAGTATLPLGSMDDTMAEALAAIKNRH